MNRLTIKELHVVNDMNKAMDKLSKLEDIEEEIGIDLITLFKALDNGVFEKDLIDNVFHTKIRGIEKNGLCAIWKGDIPECDYTLKYKDYGKTWALSEELLKED